MRLAVVIVIAVAALFAGGVFYFLLQYMEGVEKDAFALAEQQKEGIEAVEILVADVDLPAGTVISSSSLAWQLWPDESLNDDYVVYREEDGDASQSDLEEPLYDKVVRRAITAGEPVTNGKLFTREGASFLSGMLKPGMRAVAIKVQDVTGVGGFIMPGDHVDIIVSLKWKIDQAERRAGAPFVEYTSETVVQNARVMGIDQTFNDIEENVAKAKSVTVEVTPKQAEIISIAARRGDMSLSLRSLVPGQVSAVDGFTSDRETLFSSSLGFPAADRMADPVVVANTGAGMKADGTDADAMDKDGGDTVVTLPVVQRFRVMTAQRDLAKGTLLRERDMDWAPLAMDLSPENYLIQGREAVTPRLLAGTLLNADVKAGAPLPFNDMFRPDSPEYLSLALRPGMRATQVTVPRKSFVGTPGDEVDVVLVGRIEDEQRFSETIVQKVRVLTVGPNGNRAILEVTPKQFETIAVAQTMGTLQLSLRSNNTVLTDYYAGPFTKEREVSRAISGVVNDRYKAAAEAAAAEIAAAEARARAKAAEDSARMSVVERAAAAAEAAAASAKAAELAAKAKPAPAAPVQAAPAPVEPPPSSITIYRSTSSTKQKISQ